MSNWEPYSYRKVTRDTQCLKEYRSEWEFAKKRPAAGMNPTELKRFLREVANDKWFTDRFGDIMFGIIVDRRRKKTASCCFRESTGFTLKFPADAENSRLLALHELAHTVAHRQKHGAVFCSVLLQLVTRFMGAVAGRELRRQFGIHMVELC
jgi:putative metallohydrolase (TIGR04338 family)